MSSKNKLDKKQVAVQAAANVLLGILIFGGGGIAEGDLLVSKDEANRTFALLAVTLNLIFAAAFACGAYWLAGQGTALSLVTSGVLAALAVWCGAMVVRLWRKLT